MLSAKHPRHSFSNCQGLNDSDHTLDTKGPTKPREKSGTNSACQGLLAGYPPSEVLPEPRVAAATSKNCREMKPLLSICTQPSAWIFRRSSEWSYSGRTAIRNSNKASIMVGCRRRPAAQSYMHITRRSRSTGA